MEPCFQRARGSVSQGEEVTRMGSLCRAGFARPSCSPGAGLSGESGHSGGQGENAAEATSCRAF